MSEITPEQHPVTPAPLNLPEPLSAPLPSNPPQQGQYLADASAPPPGMYPAPGAVVRANQVAVKQRNVVVVWLLLPIITLGLYQWYWYPKINAELRDTDPSIKVSPFVAWLAIVPGAFLIIPPFVSFYNTGKRIAVAQQSRGLGSSCSPVLGVLLMFVFGLSVLYYQSELNKIAASAR